MMFALLVFGAAVASLVAVPLVRRLAVALDAVDRPDARRVNERAVPRLGGVAIFAGCALAAAAVALWGGGAALEGAWRANPWGVAGFAAGAGLMFIVGVGDDLVGLRPRTKLAGAVVAALLAVFVGGCRIATVSIPGGGALELGWLAAPLTVLWIVAVTNALNLLDGLDGLAAAVTVVALGTVVVIGGPGHGAVTVVATILIGATLGFLAHNMHPASIFLGDSGSLFLGFCLAVLATYAGAKSAVGAVTLATVLIVALPLGDIVWAMARRYVRGLVPLSVRSHAAGLARMFVPDRNHIHHRLLASGLSHRQSVATLVVIQALACAGAIYLATGLSPRTPAAAAPAPRTVEAEVRVEVRAAEISLGTGTIGTP